MKRLRAFGKDPIGLLGSSSQSLDEDFSAFIELASLMNVSLTQIKDECCVFQTKKLMNKLGKVLVRFNLKEREIERVLLNANTLGLSEVLISSAYLPSVKKIVKKHGLEKLKICTIIDFPFGEGLIKTKLLEAKNCLKQGVDGISVVFPTLLASDEHLKETKRQFKKVARLSKESSVAISCTELNENEIKNFIKVAEKTKVKSITFLFGETDLEDLKLRTKIINSVRGKKPIKVLGNIDTAVVVMELFKKNIDCILTPSATEIGEELIKRFKIKSVKLK